MFHINLTLHNFQEVYECVHVRLLSNVKELASVDVQ